MVPASELAGFLPQPTTSRKENCTQCARDHRQTLPIPCVEMTCVLLFFVCLYPVYFVCTKHIGFTPYHLKQKEAQNAQGRKKQTSKGVNQRWKDVTKTHPRQLSPGIRVNTKYVNSTKGASVIRFNVFQTVTLGRISLLFSNRGMNLKKKII